jgi:hypothetical protein
MLPANLGTHRYTVIRDFVPSEIAHTAPPAAATESSGAIGARATSLMAPHKAQKATASATLTLNGTNPSLSTSLLKPRINNQILAASETLKDSQTPQKSAALRAPDTCTHAYIAVL